MRSRPALFAGCMMMVTMAGLTSALGAQGVRRPPWTLTGAVEVLHAGRTHWGFGPALSLRRDFGPRWGVELRAALPAFGQNGGGAAVDLAATYVEFRGMTEVGASLGGTAFLVGDNSELVGGGVGVYAAAHATTWVTHGFGLTAGASVRTAIGVYPAGYAGVTVRF